MSTSFSSDFFLPKDLNRIVVDYLSSPIKATSNEIDCSIRELENLSATYRDFTPICEKPLTDLYKLKGLVEKYSKYNQYYEIPRFIAKTDQALVQGNPQLLDALFSGFSYAQSTFDEYTPEIEEDIKEIIRLTPQSVNCKTLNVKRGVTPLMAACINKKIPLHIIELLLQNGGDPNAIIEVNREPRTILEDLSANINAIGQERFESIKDLFNQRKLDKFRGANGK